MKSDKKLIVQLSDDIHYKLKVMAACEKTSIREIVTNAINKYMNIHKHARLWEELLGVSKPED